MFRTLAAGRLSPIASTFNLRLSLGNNSKLSLFESLLPSSVVGGTGCATLRRSVLLGWINEKIEQIEDLNEAISAQTTERAAYRSHIAVGNTAARGNNSVSAGSSREE